MREENDYKRYAMRTERVRKTAVKRKKLRQATEIKETLVAVPQVCRYA
jgi:hypothetical protein